MIFRAFLFLIFAISQLSDTEAKVFTRCELAKTLYRTYKFQKNLLANWVCLIEAESGRDTSKVGPPNKNKSRDYGLFQINSLYWCSGGPASKHNECKLSCRALTNNNLNDDVACARKIYGRHKFSAWYGWRNKCQGKNVSKYIANCKL